MKVELILLAIIATARQFCAIPSQLPSLRVRKDEVDSICETQSDWTILANPYDCKKFFACVNSKPEEFNCAPNYYFNKLELLCVPGDCDTGPSNSTTQNCKSNQDPIRVDGDCHSYKICINGTYLLSHCRPGQYFDSSVGRCQPILNNSQYKCSCLVPEYTVLTNPNDCETFFMCVGGKAVLHQCPSDQYYNETFNKCIVDLDGTCMMEPTISTDTFAVTSVCQDIKEFTKSVFRPDPNDCTQFYICHRGNAFKKHCTKGLYFDSELKYCSAGTPALCKTSVQDKVKELLDEFEDKVINLTKDEELSDYINGKETSPKNSSAQKKRPDITPLEQIEENTIKYTHSETVYIAHEQQDRPQIKVNHDKLSSKFMEFQQH